MRKLMPDLTLIELMIIVAIAVMVTSVSFGMCTRTSGASASAPAAARQYARQMGLTVTGLTCVSRDTDGDGYVSCTINSKGTLYHIECADNFFSTGCRAPKPQVRPRW